MYKNVTRRLVNANVKDDGRGPEGFHGSSRLAGFNDKMSRMVAALSDKPPKPRAPRKRPITIRKF